MLILIVEDEVALAKLMIEYLEGEGIECDHATSVAQAKSLIQTHEFDVLVLDVNLPDGNGFALCADNRQAGLNTPTIMLTARSTLEDKSKGFAAGVDDYLVKPFAMEELVMRLHALAARGKRSDQFNLGPLTLYMSKREAWLGEQPLALTPDEWRLLLLLVSRENVAVTKDKLFSHMWPDDSGTDDALKMLVFRLRKQLRSALKQQNFSENAIEVQTIRCVGLKLVIK